jgi:hypothetical protein
MTERFAERIREAQETIEVLRKVHPANHPGATETAEVFELHAAHERKHGRTKNAERAAQRAARLREPELGKGQYLATRSGAERSHQGRTGMKNATRSGDPRGTETRTKGDNSA